MHVCLQTALVRNGGKSKTQGHELLSYHRHEECLLDTNAGEAMDQWRTSLIDDEVVQSYSGKSPSKNNA